MSIINTLKPQRTNYLHLSMSI